MILYIIGGYILLPNLFNLVTGIHVRKKTLNNIIKNIEDSGYIIDSRYKENLPKKIFEKVSKKDFLESDYVSILLFGTWCPFLRLICLYCNIKYLTGNYVGWYEGFGELEDLSLRQDIINYLEKEGLIKEDLEQQIWLEDRKTALKKLEDKYDDIQVNKSINLHSFSENDSTKELYAKMEILQEMIERRKSEKQNNDNKSNTITLQNKQRI